VPLTTPFESHGRTNNPETAVAIRLTPAGGWASLAGAEDRALPTPDVQPAFPTLTTSAPLNVTTSNALRVADAYACVRLLADTIATLPLKAYRRTDQGACAGGR
jgi:hypothetical protein